jgi:S1-C subfamily serine protease
MTDRQPTGTAGSGPYFSRRNVLSTAVAWCASASLSAGAASAAASARPLDHLLGISSARTIGSAFFLRPGIAVTNAHVVSGLGDGAAVTILDTSGRHPARARLIAASDRMDLALLAAPEGLLPPVPRHDAPQRRGLAVLAAGVDPLSRQASGLELRGKIADAALDLPGFGSGLLVRLPGVRRGFSGGPVLDLEGRLVGMLTSIRVTSGKSAASPRQTAFAPLRIHDADEAFVLRASDIRHEAERMLTRHGA